MKTSQVKDRTKGIDIPPDAPEEIPVDEVVNTEEETQETEEKRVDNQLSDDPLINKKVFETRRKMAWISLYIMIGMVAISYLYVIFVLGLYMQNMDLMLGITESYKTHLEWAVEIIGWGFLSFSSVVLGYMGSTVVSHLGFLRKNKR